MHQNTCRVRAGVARRELLLAATATLAVSVVPREAQAQDASLPHSDVRFDDGLAIPMPADPSLGKGKDLALVLGGGGEYFAAWMLGFAQGLHENGVTYEMPDVIVGTSGRLGGGQHHRGRPPGVVDARVRFLRRGAEAAGGPGSDAAPNASQKRAHELCNTATNASIETMQAIGRGAMAALNPSVAKLQTDDWRPHPQFVVAQAQVPCRHHGLLQRATARRIGWQRCAHLARRHGQPVAARHLRPDLDQGPGVHGRRDAARQSTDSDLVAGAKRARRRLAHRWGAGQRPALLQHPQHDPAGDQEFWKRPAPGPCSSAANPGKVNLVSPEEIKPAMQLGDDRGVREAVNIKAFWLKARLEPSPGSALPHEHRAGRVAGAEGADQPGLARREVVAGRWKAMIEPAEEVLAYCRG